MSKTLLQAFSEVMGHVKINSQVAKELYQFQVSYVNKNHEHMEFFGGNLTGVNILRFTDKDFKTFYTDILDTDYDALSQAILEVDEINQNFKISSDVFNNTCMYLIHAIFNSKLINHDQRERAALDVALLFNYRCITALLTYYFKYPIDTKTAESTYAQLSERFLIKKLGSWNEVMLYRAHALIDKDSIHRKELESYRNDSKIVYAMNDSQGRVRDMLKNIYAEFWKVHKGNSNDKIQSRSNTGVNADGDEIVKDKTHGLEVYTNYIMSVMGDKNSYIKDELVEVIVKLVYTVQKKHLVTTLEWMADNYGGEHHKAIESLTERMMLYSYQYLLEHRYVLKNKQDLSGLLTKLRGIYTSSRSMDDDLLSLRDDGNAIVKAAIIKINDQALSSARTALFLYISLRAYTKNAYV